MPEDVTSPQGRPHSVPSEPSHKARTEANSVRLTGYAIAIVANAKTVPRPFGIGKPAYVIDAQLVDRMRELLEQSGVEFKAGGVRMRG